MLAPPKELLEKQLDFVNGYADCGPTGRGKSSPRRRRSGHSGSRSFPCNGADPRTLELMALALRMASTRKSVQECFAVLRRMSYSADPTAISTPLHASFPSGHCTEAHAVAFVLHAVVATSGTSQPEKDAVQLLRVQLMRQAPELRSTGP